jgi:hypothetical protein
LLLRFFDVVGGGGGEGGMTNECTLGASWTSF